MPRLCNLPCWSKSFAAFAALLFLHGVHPASPLVAQEKQVETTRRLFELSRPAMGVELRILAWCTGPEQAEEALEAAAERVEALNHVLSNYAADSEVRQLMDRLATGGPFPVSDDLWAVLARSKSVWEESDGRFDVTVGHLSNLWREARRTETLPEQDKIDAALQRTGQGRLQLDDATRTVDSGGVAVSLDFGGIGKGYAADAALSVLGQYGVDSALVDLGGDIAVGRAPPGAVGWRIGIDPLDSHRPRSFVVLKSCGIASSGDKHQFATIAGVRYGHLIDPATGLALQRSSVVTVIASNATDADAWATVYSLVEPDKVIAMAAERDGHAVRGEVLLPGGKPERFQTPGFPPLQDADE